jgi:hypothetical protein
MSLLRQQARENGGEFAASVKTTGWRPGCECGLEPVPSTVLDPFGGAGTSAVAAVKLGRSATIIELNPAYCAIARKRIDAAQAAVPSFPMTILRGPTDNNSYHSGGIPHPGDLECRSPGDT